ncbi:39S ribosomal protein L35, mitochondrial isoform X1 [Coturnix japonica]|uniref:39S ribosomal protein L35, mitochondrial isoform X1 n=1 Tax=Coturnix japonica TaxID=93934 RepID=UPI0007778146|nr:39S ribosomal protein L35, mitochondrial isoform X1 [Coturnix japonica]
MAAVRAALTGMLRPLSRWAPLAAGRTAAVRCCHSPVWAAAPLPKPPSKGIVPGAPCPSLVLRLTPLLPNILQQPTRPVTYYGLRKGKRKTVKAVVKRFLRLHCGLWVRRKSGYKKKLWKKSTAQKKRLREFVLCNRTQSKLLDKMTTSFWKRRNWYVDDPYQKYHDRTNLSV